MAKFKYKMQNILNIKLKLEEQVKMDFAAKMRTLNEEEEKLSVIEKRKHLFDLEGKKLRSENLNILKLKENNEAIKILIEEIEKQRGCVEKAKKNVELAREQLRVAMQERKTQEKLSENAFEVFKKEINAQESKEVDELTSYTYGVRQSKIKGKDWVISDGRK